MNDIHRRFEFVTQAGPIVICSVWEFLSEVRKEYHPKFHENTAELMRELHTNRWAPHSFEASEAYAKSVHKLVQNPVKLITELKKTTSSKKYTRNIGANELIHDAAKLCVMEYGQPTHFFCTGENQYALVNKDDVTLYVTDNFRQQLVCNYKERNLTITANNVDWKRLV